MTIPKLRTVEDICRWLVPTTPEGARRQLHHLLYRIHTTPETEWTKEPLARLRDYVIDLCDEYPDAYPAWVQEWQESRLGVDPQ